MTGTKPKAIGVVPLGGGTIIGLEQAGFDTVACMEINDAWAGIVQLNRPDIPYKTGLEEWEEWAESLDEHQPQIVHGIPPCQGVSGVNAHSSADNPKNEWLLHATKAAMLIKPEVAFFENIPRMLSVGKPIVNRMDELARRHGYVMSIHRHNAMKFGVSQNRRRVLFVFERKGSERYWPEPQLDAPPTVWDAISDLDRIEPLPVAVGKTDDGGLAYTPFFYEGDADNEWQEALRSEQGITWNHNLILSPERFKHVPQGKQWLAMPREHMTEKEIARIEGGTIFNAVETFRLHPDRVGPTLTGARNKLHPTQNRVITMREMCRMMGYPDGWAWPSNDDYQLAAAGVCPPVARHFGEVLMAYIADTPLPVAEGRLF